MHTIPCVSSPVLFEHLQIAIVVSNTLRALLRATDIYIVMDFICYKAETHMGACYVLFIKTIDIGQGRTITIRDGNFEW
jgi:hypothetical protein